MDTAFSCNIDACSIIATEAESSKPTVALMAAQLSSTSIITTLFGAFFSAQSLSRLVKEHRNGTLQKKWRQLVIGSTSLNSNNNKHVAPAENRVRSSSQRGTVLEEVQVVSSSARQDNE